MIKSTRTNFYCLETALTESKYLNIIQSNSLKQCFAVRNFVEKFKVFLEFQCIFCVFKTYTQS